MADAKSGAGNCRNYGSLASMKRVVIESPYAAANGHTVAEHEKYARRCMADSLARGEAPLASHLLYTQPGILDDTDPEERKRGMEAGFEWMQQAEIVAVYADLGISRGMRCGMIAAAETGVKVVTRHIGKFNADAGMFAEVV